MDYNVEKQRLKEHIEKLQAEKQQSIELAQQKQQTAQQLQLVIDLSETGTWEWNVQTGETVFNSQWAAMLGYGLNELQPISIETWMKYTHPDDLKIAQQQLDKYFKHETTLYEAEFRMKHRDGHWVWVLDRGQVAHWTPDGKPLLMFGTHQNINNIKNTEIELKKEEARLESLLKISQHPAHTVQELLDFALEEAIALTASKIGYIYFYDEGRKEFTLNTWSKEVRQQCHVVEPRTIYSLDKTGIWGEAVRQAKPIVVNNFAASNPLKKGVPDGHAPLHKFLTIPVFDGGKIVAVVGVANKADDYDPSDIRQLTLMMDSVWKNVQRKETEQKLEKANRLYAVISQVNQAIVHNRDRQKLLKEICRVAIDFGKFSMAWVGLLNNETNIVEPVAVAGEEKGYLSKILQITLDKKLGGSGPVGTSIRTNKHFVCNDIANDSAMRFWKDEALKRNYRSVIGLPLCLYGKPIAAFAIYSDQINFFNPDEIKLLEEVANDISYALDAIETEAEQKKAEEQVLKSEAKFRNLMNQMQLGMAVHEIILDKSGQPVDYRFLDCNPAFEELTGLKRDNILGKTILEILPGTEKVWIDNYGKVAITGQSITFDNYANEFGRYYSVKAYQPSPMQFAVTIEDITIQKQALKNLETSNQKFQLLSKAATEMLLLKTLDEIYTYITSSLHNQYPDAVILFLLVDEEKNKSKLIDIKGIDNKLVNKTIQLAGFDFTKLEFNLISDHFKHFKSGKLYRFEKGLADFAGPQFPRVAAKAIEKLLGIKHIHTIGINKDDKLYATIHFLNRGTSITDNEFIESFVRQAGIVIERAMTAELLSLSEEKYRLITENASDVIWVLNVNTRKFTYISPAIKQLRGFTVEEAMNQTLEEAVTPESLHHIQRALQINLSKFLSNSLELEYYIDEIQQPCKDGHTIWVEVSTKFRLNRFGEIEVVGVSRNIEERKKMVAAIKENEIKFHLLFENSPLGIYIANRQGEIEDANPVLLSILGSPSLDKTKEINVLQFPPLVGNGYASHFRKCIETNKIINIEMPYTTHWGKKIYLSSYLVPLTNAQGKVEKVYTLMEDITLRKHNEEELMKLSLVARQNPASIVITDLEGNIEYVNAKFSDVTGYQEEEVIGKNPRLLKSEETPSEQYKKLWETIVSGNEWKGEFHNRRKNGELYWEKANIIPIKNNKGQIMNFLAIKEDITEQRKAQQALVESEALLKEAVDTKDKFFSIVSHDLRGPISSMVSLTELMTDPAYSFTPDEIHTYTASLHHTADSTYRLLENLLEWSRLQRGTIPFMPELIDVSGLLNTCDLSLTEKARNKHIDLKMNYQEGLTLVADENMLRSVIRNLLSNAIKFTKPGGEIQIEVNKTENNEIIFIIKDNGIGMPQKILDGIFKVAENVSRPGTNNEPSSGLGLILCKEFIEKHGGRIWSESEEGKGSAFYFVLPVEHTTTVVI